MEAQSAAVVYIGGTTVNASKRVWYCLDLESLKKMIPEDVSKVKRPKKKKVCVYNSVQKRPIHRWVTMKTLQMKKKSQRIKLATAAQIKDRLSGHLAVIGEDLYCFGRTLVQGRIASTDLFKKDRSPNTSSWERLDSSKFVSFSALAFFAVGGKLYVLAGPDPGNPKVLCGQIYDPVSRKWEYLKHNIDYPHPNRTHIAPYVALTENDTQVLYYSIFEGSVLFYDLASGQFLRKEEDHAPLALFGKKKKLSFLAPPLGLENCPYIESLVKATLLAPARLINNTLYWFTSDKYLYGYDLILRRWFQSKSLEDQLPTVDSPCPFLVDLPNAKLLLVAPERHGEFTVAPFTVSRCDDSLIVTVESVYPLSLDNTSFIPDGALSLLKNTWSGTMLEPVKSARES